MYGLEEETEEPEEGEVEVTDSETDYSVEGDQDEFEIVDEGEINNPDEVGLIRFYETFSKKRSLLTKEGFEYGFDHVPKTQPGKEVWKCPIRVPYCTGRISVDYQWYIDENNQRYKLGIYLSEAHTCEADPAKKEVLYL